jgi:5-methylcytosine-specific restriction endonuclease McrA
MSRTGPASWNLIACPRCKAKKGVRCTGGYVHPERTKAKPKRKEARR